MRLGILSDTHDQVQRAAQAVKTLEAEGAEALVHCGDLTGPDAVHACAGILPAYFVFGNNDYDEKLLAQAIELIGGICLAHAGTFTFGGKTVAVTHGDSGKHMRTLLARQPDYLLHGHWHITSDQREGPTRVINPGALHRARTWTVALLDVETDELKFLEIH